MPVRGGYVPPLSKWAGDVGLIADVYTWNCRKRLMLSGIMIDMSAGRYVRSTLEAGREV